MSKRPIPALGLCEPWDGSDGPGVLHYSFTLKLDIPDNCMNCGRVFEIGDDIGIHWQGTNGPTEMREGAELGTIRYLCEECEG
jgi:hypothetical protein